MKVMTAMYTMKRGGAYDRFIMMIEAFVERGCEVHCLSLTPIPIKHPIFYNHILFLPFRKTDGFIARLFVLIVFPFWSILVCWRHRIDLIIAFGSLYAFLMGLSKKIFKRPMVTLIRLSSFSTSTTQESLREVSLKTFQYLGLIFSDRIITNYNIDQDDILKELEKRRGTKIEILYNNIPSIKYSPTDEIFEIRNKYEVPNNAKIIVTAGMISRRKNMEILIKCLPEIRINNLYLIIAGDSMVRSDLKYKDHLKRLAKELRIDQKVIFTGWIEKEELWKIYQASDLFVMPSLNEGMPNVMLEALGFDLPCLGSRISGIKDILQHEDLMFDPLDEQALADKIRRLFYDIGYLSKMKRLCQERKKVFNFDWGKKVFQMIAERN